RRGQGGLLHVARQREVPASRRPRRSDPLRARDGPVPRQDVQDERRGVRGRAGRGGGGHDGVGGGPVIHRTALVDPTAHIDGDVTVGPYAIIGPHVTVGERCHIAAHAVLERNVKLGQGVTVGYGSVLGNDPQDLKYKGEDTWVEGGGSRVRQHVRPYPKGVGNPVDLCGVDSVGLQRARFSPEVKLALKRAYRLLFNSDMTVSQGSAKARAELPPIPEVENFLKFIEGSQRGVLV